MTIGWHRFRFGNPDDALRPGPGRRQVSYTSLGTWPVGVSYGTFRDTWLVGDGAGLVTAQTLRVSQVGISVLQSVAPGLVVGSTLKLLRGGFASAAVTNSLVEGALDAGDALDVDRRTTADLDLSVMASSDLIRVGLTFKNLRSPSFGANSGTAGTLPRHARVGLAVMPLTGVTLAMDVDLDTVDLVGGLRRMGAVGGEAMLSSRLGVRAGVRWSLVGSRRPMTAVGVSVGVRQGVWLDGHYTTGRHDEARELGVALRAGF
jgi:hypothetical protein